MASGEVKKWGVRALIPVVFLVVGGGLVLVEIGSNVREQLGADGEDLDAVLVKPPAVSLPDSLVESTVVDPELGEFGVRGK